MRGWKSSLLFLFLLHCMQYPQKALAPYIIDEALGRWDPALKVSVFLFCFYADIFTYLNINTWLINGGLSASRFQILQKQLLEYSS